MKPNVEDLLLIGGVAIAMGLIVLVLIVALIWDLAMYPDAEYDAPPWPVLPVLRAVRRVRLYAWERGTLMRHRAGNYRILSHSLSNRFLRAYCALLSHAFATRGAIHLFFAQEDKGLWEDNLHPEDYRRNPHSPMRRDP